MIEVTHLHRNDTAPVDDWLDLPYELRCRSRFRTTTRSGADIGVIIERGLILDEGDVLIGDEGKRFGINAANENVVTARTEDWLAFARACYHLGNRHVPMQIGERWLRIQPDHVLEELIVSFGLTRVPEQQPFRPEGGAYRSGSSSSQVSQIHAHDHSRGHSHDQHDHHH